VSIISGLPGELIEDGLVTINLVKELDVSGYYHQYLSVFVDTELQERNYEQLGIKVEESRKIFPLKISHPYDIGKIPVLDNAQLQEYLFSSIRILENILFEW